MRAVEQHPLPLRLASADVNRSEVMALPTIERVMEYTLARGPWLNDKDAARQLGIDPGLYSRRRHAQAPWTVDDVARVMGATQCLAPLVWMAGQVGHALVMMETEAERQVRELRDDLQREREERKAVEGAMRRMLIGVAS